MFFNRVICRLRRGRRAAGEHCLLKKSTLILRGYISGLDSRFWTPCLGLPVWDCSAGFGLLVLDSRFLVPRFGFLSLSLVCDSIGSGFLVLYSWLRFIVLGSLK